MIEIRGENRMLVKKYTLIISVRGVGVKKIIHK